MRQQRRTVRNASYSGVITSWSKVSQETRKHETKEECLPITLDILLLLYYFLQLDEFTYIGNNDAKFAVRIHPSCHTFCKI